MKWLVTLTLVAASVSLLLPALLKVQEIAQSNGKLDDIHKTATV